VDTVRACALAALVVAATLPRASGAQVLEQREAGFEIRREWINQLRAYPFDEYVQNPVYAARAAVLTPAPGMGAARAALTTWREIGPFGFQTSGFYGSSPNADGGRIRAIAIHPTNPGIVYAGAASGGVWRTNNGGASWTPLTDRACSLNIGSIAIDPVDPAIVYVGTGEPTQSNGCGLLRSFDGGLSWTEINGGGVLAPVNGTQTTRAYRLRVAPGTAGSQTATTVLYAANNGLHRSINSGTSWSTVLSGLVTDVEFHPEDDRIVWAARAGNSGTANGVYRSLDRGATWTQVYTAHSQSQRLAIAVSPAAPDAVWVVEIVGSRMDKLARIDGTTLVATQLAATGLYNPATRLDFGTQSTYNLVLEVDPDDAGTVILGGSRIYQSRDGGGSFSLIAYDLHVDWHAFEYAPSDPNVIVGGCDGGVHASYDRGNSWVSRNTNISVTQFYPGIALHPTVPDFILGGLQDNSSLWGFGSGFWTMSAASGDGGWNAFSPIDPNVFWATSYTTGYIIRVTRSTLGTGLSRSGRGFQSNDRKQFLSPMVIDPVDPALLYYGTYRVWRTTSEGQSWAPISSDLTKGFGTITSMAIAPTDSRVIWVGTSDGVVQLSQDAGTTFDVVSTALPNRGVTDIAVDPVNPGRVVITYSGTGTGHVYVTGDFGATWTNLTGSLPDIPFNAAVFIPGTPRIFVAADVGIYESVDNGATWNVANIGFPNARVLDLAYQHASATLYASTYGRGLWAATLLPGASVLRGDLNDDGQVNAFDAALAQQALVGILPVTSPSPMPRADANCNGVLDSGDVLAILQYAVGAAPETLCVGKQQ
jgi:photosystem II stability/assembly factor-like uncharacterized protein